MKSWNTSECSTLSGLTNYAEESIDSQLEKCYEGAAACKRFQSPSEAFREERAHKKMRDIAVIEAEVQQLQ